MASDYCIEIWQKNDDDPEQLYSRLPDLFFIEFKIRLVSSLNPETTLETFGQFLTCPRDMFLSEECGPNIILSLFSNYWFEFPESLLTHLVPDILDSAWDIDRNPANFGYKVIMLIMEVIFEVNSDDYEVDRVINDSLSTLNFKPACSSSIQALERFKWGDESNLPLEKRRLLEGWSSNKECTICLAEFLDGDEVVSMPCRHVYHDGCIVKWLETSHLCPLCRYHMPS